MSEPSLQPAIFLSYARDDAAAARRIAEALRASGLEVWFDENELRGGDAWDAKIRQQIDACTLFVPLISQATEGRAKGYFRLEWKLAVEQTHLLAEGVPFIAPVVIDDTRETGAVVPAEFLKVQWTRLPGGLPTPQFVGQMKRLLHAPKIPTGATRAPMMEPGRPRPGERGEGAASPTKPPEVGRRVPATAWIGFAAVIAIGGVITFFVTRKPEPPAAAAPALSSSKGPAATTEKSAAAPGKSIAVLPFTSTEKDNESFADGVHEDVLTNLAKIRDLKVISRPSVLVYRDPSARTNLKKIAADLDVATVLDGSVRRSGNQVRVTANLIDVRTAASLWAESYDGELTDVFALQAKLAQAIANALKVTLTSSERALIERRPTQNAAAYEIYLRAFAFEQALTTRSSREKFEQTITLYDQAVSLDPGFALAYARLTRLHGAMFFLASLDPTPARLARARATVEAAERFAPGAPETREARGSFTYFCDNDWNRALGELGAAEASLPNDALLLTQIAFAHRRLGQMPDAVRFLERGSALNPHDLYTGSQLVQTLFLSRRYDLALAGARRFTERFPTDAFIRDLGLRAQFALDGDRAAFVRARTALPPQDNDPLGLRAAYENAMLSRDYAGAARALADPRLTTVVYVASAIADPVALHRALLAFLRGETEAARKSADEALTFFHGQPWMPRQEPFVRAGCARAAAYAGRPADAMREAEAALQLAAGRDSFSEAWIRYDVAVVWAVLGRHDEALAALRELMKGMTHFSPNELRYDPLLARLKDDPRFEEILKSAKLL